MVYAKKYVIAGAVLVLVLAALFWFGSRDTTTESDKESALTAVSSFDHAHGMAVDLKDPRKLYIATHTGLYVLQDDADLFRIGKTQDDLMGFTAHPKNSGGFFSSGHPARGGNIGFQKSTDGGVTWEKVSPGLNGPVDFHAMTISMINPDIVYGFYGGKLQRSSDGGRAWEYAQGDVRPIVLSTDPLKENVVYAATEDGVQTSEDRGNSWKNLSPALAGGWVSVFALAPDGKRALAFSEAQGGMAVSADSGISWQKVNESFAGGVVHYIAWSSSQPGLVYAVTDRNAIYKSSDGGIAWQALR